MSKYIDNKSYVEIDDNTEISIQRYTFQKYEQILYQHKRTISKYKVTTFKWLFN